MLLALTGGQKLGIALTAAAFVAFAVLSAFVLPRRDPNFPGRHLWLFVIVAILFFAGMMTAMATLAKESEEEGRHEAGPATSGETQQKTTQGTTGAAPKGDPAAGKQIFASAGCEGCHTLQAAGAKGTIGPNLDQLKPSFDAVVKQVTNGGGAMPAFKGKLSQKQIQDVAAFVSQSTH